MSQFLDFTTLERLPPRKSYLLAPEGVCENATPDGPAELFRRSPMDLLLALRTHLETVGGVTALASDRSVLAISYVAVTPLLKFKDDVDIRVFDAEAGSAMAIYSRSRVGRSDLGTNKKRVEKLIADIRSR